MSPPLASATQATQTDTVAMEVDMEAVLSGDLSDMKLIELLPRKWPNTLRERILNITEVPAEAGDTCRINDSKSQ